MRSTASSPAAIAVLITLGLIEAWFGNRSGLSSTARPKGITRTDPRASSCMSSITAMRPARLADLVDLLDQVCPRDYRVILTVSPVPLQATLTTSDVAVANCYSKSVLQAAVEPVRRRSGSYRVLPLLRERGPDRPLDRFRRRSGSCRNVDGALQRRTA